MAEAVHDAQRLKELQALPLYRKIQISQARIIEWYTRNKGNVVVSFSGGKDSTVLLHMVRTLYPDVPAVFSNTGLEYPEIQRFVRSIPNVTIVTPKMRFDQVISAYGYPLIGKEVAEAIYYARRIRSQTVQVERENETQPCGVSAENSSVIGGGNLIETSGAANRRTILQGKWGAAGNTPPENTAHRTEMPHTFAKRTELHGRRAGVKQTGTTGEGGVFSPDSKEQFGEKSIFNKEKYLPLVYTPFMISHYCCQVMKKSPLQSYQRKYKLVPYLGTLAEESRIRTQAWIRHGCNAFNSKKPTSQPLSFWTEQNILQYISDYGLGIAPVYGEIVSVDRYGNEYATGSMCAGCKLKTTGADRTGCIYCAFGFHREKGETRFQRILRTHPRQYEYALGGGQWVDNPHYVEGAPEYDGEWKNWNPKQIWVPSKKGLWLKTVFDMVNEIYGKGFYRYE